MIAPLHRPNVVGIAALFLFATAVTASAVERSVYLYAVEKQSAADWQAQLRKWQSEGIQRAIVSLEAGPKFLLADSSESYRLAELFNAAILNGNRIEGLILQDVSWALDPIGARERLGAVLDFAQLHPGLIDAVQIDVEVYTNSNIVEEGQAWRAYAALVSTLRSEIEQRRSTMRLTAALPWWLSHAVSRDEFKTITSSLDGVLLMVYGDRGGTPVAADVATFTRKVKPEIDILLGSGPRVRVGVAKYEHESPAALLQFAHELDELLLAIPDFEGVTIFHETTRFGTV